VASDSIELSTPVLEHKVNVHVPLRSGSDHRWRPLDLCRMGSGNTFTHRDLQISGIASECIAGRDGDERSAVGRSRSHLKDAAQGPSETWGGFGVSTTSRPFPEPLPATSRIRAGIATSRITKAVNPP